MLMIYLVRDIMKIEKVDNLAIAANKLLEVVGMLSESGFNVKLQERLIDTSEYLLDQYEKHNKPSEEVQDLMDAIDEVEL